MVLFSRRREPRDLSRRAPLAIAGVFAAAGLSITAVATAATVQHERDEAATETDARLSAVGTSIDRQVSRYAETLYGLRSAFAHEPGLDRQDFRQLVDIASLTRRNPGAESVTFDRSVPGDRLAAFERSTRRQLPGFQVHPRRSATEHVIVDYVEPEERGSAAYGFDIAAEPVRRTALEFARDSGELAATPPLALVQESIGAGFLLMLAAYDQDQVPVTTPARNRHFLGVLVAVFAADTMVEQALDTNSELEISIYDAGPTVDTPEADPGSQDWVVGAERPDYRNFADIDVGSRRWRIVTDEPVAASTGASLATGVSGTALTLLIAGLLASISVSRRRALSLADSMTEDLRESEERLRAANESMRAFVDIAAHDLRSPLVSIGGFSSILREGGDSLTEDDRVNALRTIERQSQHMNRLIDDMLTMSSIDGGGLQPKPETLTVAGAIADCLDATPGYQRIVSVTCPPELVVRADPHHLRRILDNYLQNALKYGSPPVRIEVSETGTMVEIRVIDQGSGVPEAFVPKLFGKFARAATPETTAQRGTGLGLSIVRGLAEANGGQADYEPHPPQGSCFVVRLPAAR